MHERDFDIAIIGSGAGGGTVAQALSGLCADGVRVAVLEWGPHFREEDFNGGELEMARRLYVDSGGVLTRDRSMTLAFGRAYGGSTVVYTGTSLVIPEATLGRWGVPGLEWEDLRRRAESYLEQNNVHLLAEDQTNDNNRLFREGCRRLGWRVERFPVNVKGCRGSGLCNLGCPHGAKQGTHRVQLPAAQRAGVQVITNCRITRLAGRVAHATVSDPGIGHPSPWPPGEYRIRARVFVVAAGAVNSPALLLRSRLPVVLPALGRWFTAHPALILVAEHERPITNFHGHPKSYYCDEFAASHGFLLETCMYFPFTTAKNLTGFGEAHSALMARMDRMQQILVLALDPALSSNRITLDRHGEPVVRYRLSPQVLDSFHAAMKAAARIFFVAGARRVHAPAGLRFFIEAQEAARLDELIPRSRVLPGRLSVSAAHLMGGCRMGSDARDSVTDAWGRVHGLSWLHVADASLFPRCAEVNPYLTIMALADRVAEGIRARAGELLAAPLAE